MGCKLLHARRAVIRKKAPPQQPRKGPPPEGVRPARVLFVGIGRALLVQQAARPQLRVGRCPPPRALHEELARLHPQGGPPPPTCCTTSCGVAMGGAREFAQRRGEEAALVPLPSHVPKDLAKEDAPCLVQPLQGEAPPHALPPRELLQALINPLPLPGLHRGRRLLQPLRDGEAPLEVAPLGEPRGVPGSGPVDQEEVLADARC
mmetsp:Transcript_62550/g.153726  ORF Transcript_62550/g.153726 Transcript_62550/m.153726 type:complete len:205 (+) Transcript_62550:741-1355(+)